MAGTKSRFMPWVELENLIRWGFKDNFKINFISPVSSRNEINIISPAFMAV